MDLDDELCLCFHVTKRKVVNYLRIERPRSASQLSDCHGAGTGCGWCRNYLKKLFEASRAANTGEADLPTAADYAQQRASYIRSGGGTPPAGATPIE
ncbi:(2Fe-2S)-binding protein [Aeoliella sp. ICT_H6.2]|uniref:(2Fe-2S)-binding protein n=1 Tax=Aeoliella straminimaris TaxID=2954799 RepID=A0A9X2F9N7_9BACT|nr:(2Fe-2S)-binding protein [Aeoliella straminimaris]MCO6044972.1 (2Fe-2S)-binding protein [Aeoliella straminimaris]